MNAKELDLDTPLPRIPPLRGKVGVDFNFTTETRTPGYAVVNLVAAYTIARQHVAHQFSSTCSTWATGCIATTPPSSRTLRRRWGAGAV